MGTATQLGSFGAFIAVWVAMMAAMMLPGAAPAVLRRAQAGGVRAVPLFVGAYLAVWALAGVLVYAVDRPHGTLAAGTGGDRGRLSTSSRRSSGTAASAAARAPAPGSASGCTAPDPAPG